MENTRQTTRILNALTRRKGENVSVDTLSRNAKVTKDQLYRGIFVLRKDGFQINTNQRTGKTYYKLAA